MFQRFEIKDESFESLIDNGQVTILIRLANTCHNWSSVLDKDIARKIPELKKVDENELNPRLGESTRVVKELNSRLLLGHRRVECFNCYCLEKDKSGRFILNKNSLKNFLKKLEEKKRETIFTLLVKNDSAISKTLIYKLLQETVQFNKAWILG